MNLKEISSWKAWREAYFTGKRLPELEDIIMNDSCFSYRYAVNVIKGKLPDKMHNMMILYAIKDPEDDWAKQYFEYISK